MKYPLFDKQSGQPVATVEIEGSPHAVRHNGRLFVLNGGRYESVDGDIPDVQEVKDV